MARIGLVAIALNILRWVPVELVSSVVGFREGNRTHPEREGHGHDQDEEGEDFDAEEREHELAVGQRVSRARQSGAEPATHL